MDATKNNLKSVSSSLAKNYKFIGILLLVLIFIIAAYYVFRNFVKPKCQYPHHQMFLMRPVVLEPLSYPLY